MPNVKNGMIPGYNNDMYAMRKMNRMIEKVYLSFPKPMINEFRKWLNYEIKGE